MSLKYLLSFGLLLQILCYAQTLSAQHIENDSRPNTLFISLLGYWENIDAPNSYLKLEEERFLLKTQNNEIFSLPIQSYNKTSINIPHLGQALTGGMTIRYEVSNGILSIEKNSLLKGKSTDKQREFRFQKLSQKPANLKLEPIPMAKTKNLSAHTIELITQSLEERKTRDQTSRRSNYGKNAIEAQQTDSQWLEDVILKYGWIDTARFGQAAVSNAFLIAQHTLDMRLRLAAQSGLENDMKKGKPVHGLYAWLYDRNSLYLYGYQKFGTHYRALSSGNVEIMPLENINKVDKYRKEIRLAPITNYKEELSKSFPKHKVIILEW